MKTRMRAPVIQNNVAYQSYDPFPQPVAAPSWGDSWVCPQCTYENVKGGPSCEICAAARPVQSEHPAKPEPSVHYSTEELKSPKHRREAYRKELVVIAPTIQMLFKSELPDTRCSYVVEIDDDMDELGSRYLSDLRQKVYSGQGHVLLPLNTTGDGSCLLHACSRSHFSKSHFSKFPNPKFPKPLLSSV